MLSPEELHALPKVVLHDYLDGGLWPATVVEHCTENGHELPTTDLEKLGRWFFESADFSSLIRYLEGFTHTITAMQTRDQLVRVARGFVLGQAANGAVYIGVHWAPEQHLEEGLMPEAVVEVVHDGLAEDMAQTEVAGWATVATQTVTTTCHVGESTTGIAELVLAYRGDSVVGYDITGAEMGFRPARLQASFGLLRHNGTRFTIHAGEADRPRSVWEAIRPCDVQRIGHGMRVCENIEGFWGDRPGLGRFAAFVRDQQIPLEVCPTSGLQTGVAKSLDRHPVERPAELGSNVAIHCDNHLMSGTSLSEEFAELSGTFGWGSAEVEAVTVAAMHAAFLHHGEREALVERLIRPAFHAIRRKARA